MGIGKGVKNNLLVGNLIFDVEYVSLYIFFGWVFFFGSCIDMIYIYLCCGMCFVIDFYFLIIDWFLIVYSR